MRTQRIRARNNDAATRQRSGGAPRDGARQPSVVGRRLARTTLVLAAIVALTGSVSEAAGQRTQVRPVALDSGVERIRSEVTVQIDGDTRVARFEVQEEFLNHGARLGEADYLYPVPAGAVFSNLSLFVGETELRGEMLPADQARGIYEEIVRRRKDPALVELLGSGVIRARVFPIEPGDTRKIILRYTQVLPRDADIVRMTYQRRAGMIAAADEIVETGGERRRQRSADGQGSFALRVRVDGAGRYATPVSPTHEIEVHRRDGGVVDILVAESSFTSDFELLLPLRRNEVGLSLITHSPAPGREDGYFLLLVTPPQGSAEARLPRDVTLVLDVSGSMSGHKIQQARSALEQILRGMGAEDRFRLIAFSSVVRSFAEEFQRADESGVAGAIEWLRSVAAEGSTNLYEALEVALEPVTDPERLALVVFLTDGLPTVSETDPERIAEAAERLRDGERVFAFGVGDDVNTYLLDRLARGGRGTVSYVRSTEDVEGAVSSLTRRIGAPVLADLRIDRSPVRLEDAYPDPLPDLFAGEELMLLGRYRGAGSGRLIIAGQRGTRAVHHSFEVNFPERQGDNEFITRLWAARKAGALTAEIRINGANPEVIEEIRQLGLRYGVLTEYTAYLVQEPGMALRMDGDELFQEVRAEAPAPAQQTGALSFRRARASSKLSAADTVAEAEEALLDATGGDGNVGGRETWRRVGRRLFAVSDGRWSDVRAPEDGNEIAIEPYSPAWFEVLEQLPGLRQAAALGDSVVIAGEGIVLRFEAGGAARITGEQMWQLRLGFPLAAR